MLVLVIQIIIQSHRGQCKWWHRHGFLIWYCRTSSLFLYLYLLPHWTFVHHYVVYKWIQQLQAFLSGTGRLRGIQIKMTHVHVQAYGNMKMALVCLKGILEIVWPNCSNLRIERCSKSSSINLVNVMIVTNLVLCCHPVMSIYFLSCHTDECLFLSWTI